MKLSWIILIAPILLTFACRKPGKNNDNDNNGVDTAAPFAYSLKHDSVVICNAGKTYNYSFYVKLLGGNIANNRLTCSLEGLPAGVGVSPATMTVGYLLGGVFSIKVGSLPNGDYPFTLKVTSEKYGDQVYNAILRIVSPPDFAPALVGTYDSSYDFCPASGIQKYASTVSTVPDTAFLLKITNVHNMGAGVVLRALVSDVITVPVQSVGGKTIWGSGFYSPAAPPAPQGEYLMEIHDTLVVGLDTSICTIHIEH